MPMHHHCKCDSNETVSRLDFTELDIILHKMKNKNGALISILQSVQKEYGYLPEEIVEHVASKTDIQLSQLYGVITFYSQFRQQPVGEYLIKVCHGTACHVNGAEALQEAVEDELGIVSGETTSDGKFTVQKVACLGACSLAPVMMVNDRVYGRLDGERAKKVVMKYRKVRSKK